MYACGMYAHSLKITCTYTCILIYKGKVSSSVLNKYDTSFTVKFILVVFLCICKLVGGRTKPLFAKGVR